MSARDLDASFISDALPAFISEAHEQVEAIEHLLLELEDRPADRDLLDHLFRCAHTVKGSAGVFGLDAVVAFTHHVETLLDLLREGRMGFDGALGSLLLSCNDQIRHLVAAAASGESDTDDDSARRQALVAQLQQRCAAVGAAASAPAGAAAAVQAPAAAQAPGWHVAVSFGSEVFRNGSDPLALLSYLAGLGTLERVRAELGTLPTLESLDPENCHWAFEFDLTGPASAAAVEEAFAFVRDDCTLRVEPLAPPPGSEADLAANAAIATQALAAAVPSPAAAAPKAGKAREGAVEETRYIRVQADRLDAVINLLGELVIASAGAELLARDARQAVLLEANQQIGRLVEEIRNGTLQLRMVPIGETFTRFRRVVRDTAAELGKDVLLEIEGAETELDKSVVERIADPLMHLVRNALDHGLEPPAEREAAGKPPQGTLKLAACHEAGSIVIRIVDDGRGIQRRKVLERAWQRGLLETGVVPPDEDICRLIFAPGFSTAEKVTNLSGRGVGMDVVKSNIEALRGSVTIHSVEGHGSTIEIRLPLTLAIIDGFLVGVGSSRFIFPLDAVVEVIEGRAVVGHVDAQGRGCVELRGQVLPVLSLRRLYGLAGSDAQRASIVVLRGADGRRFGARVDQLLGQHQTVIKPLSRLFKSLRGMAGSSILGNGEVALIFDVGSLGSFATERPRTATRSAS